MIRLAAASVLIAALAFAGSDAAADDATPTVSASAREISFELDTGSCWGQSTARRQVAVSRSSATVRTRGSRAKARRSRAWWDDIRALLNDGLASASAPGADGCYEPNTICGFRIRVRDANGTRHQFSGCCTGPVEARQIEAAFDRLGR